MVLFYFNSIKVQLKHIVEVLIFLFLNNFNSIKVQLKLIKVLIYALGLVFQFHKGTIKTKFLSMLPMPCSYFNSIKVQLKQQYQTATTHIKKFQFHKGTIKTICR